MSFSLPVDPHKINTLDMETYYDSSYSLKAKEYNTSEYVRDPQFEAHAVSIKHGSEPVEVYRHDQVEKELRAIDWSDKALLCHNTSFDGFILAHHYGIVPGFYLDTLSMARALHANVSRASLEAVAKFYGVGNKLKMPNVRGLRAKDIPEEIWGPYLEYCAEDTRLCYLIARMMLGVYPEAELRLIDMTIRMFTQPVLKVDTALAMTVLEDEVRKKAELLEKAGLTEEDLQSANKLAAKLVELGVEPPTKISPRTEQVTYAFAASDEEFMALAAHEDERVRNVVAARLAVKSTIMETRAERFLKAGANDMCMPVLLNYWAAHTGRWGGANKLNLQNLKKDDPETGTGGELRRSLLAPKGHVVVVADSAQIEARILAWKAGQDDLVEIFRTGADPYCTLGTTIYGRTITKADKLERFVAKTARLGLGFGMGWKKFRGALALKGVQLSERECQNIVNVFRRKDTKIVDLWKDCDRLLGKMFMHKVTGKGGFGEALDLFEYDGESIWMPNGMGLHYPDLQADVDHNDQLCNFSYMSHNQPNFIWGGTLTENLIQALARIVIGEQMLAINERYRVVTMTHDEIVTVVPEAEADEALAFMIETMSTPPRWAPGLPLAAEGGYDYCYSK